MKTVKFKLLLLGAALLFLAGGISSCSKSDSTPPVDKSAFSTDITTATTLQTGAQEGVAAGNYLKGSKATFQLAIDAASTVNSSPTATQAQITAAQASLAAATTAFNAQLVTAIDPTNLVGQWTFDELTTAAAGTSVKDYSGNNRNGTLKVGHSYFGAGVPALGNDRYGITGKALLLDKGANVEIPYNAALNSATFSISAWVKLGEVRNNRFVGLQSWIGYKFEVQDGNRPFATIGYTGGAYDRDAAVAITQATWYHLVMTYTAGTMVFYINGIAVKTWTDVPNAAASIAGKPYNLVLGCDFPTDKYSSDANGTNFDNAASPDFHVIPAAWGGYLHGSLDEVRIYKSVLTIAQVTSIYNLEKP